MNHEEQPPSLTLEEKINLLKPPAFQMLDYMNSTLRPVPFHELLAFAQSTMALSEPSSDRKLVDGPMKILHTNGLVVQSDVDGFTGRVINPSIKRELSDLQRCNKVPFTIQAPPEEELVFEVLSTKNYTNDSKSHPSRLGIHSDQDIYYCLSRARIARMKLDKEPEQYGFLNERMKYLDTLLQIAAHFGYESDTISESTKAIQQEIDRLTPLYKKWSDEKRKIDFERDPDLPYESIFPTQYIRRKVG